MVGRLAVLRTRQWVDRRPILDLDRVSAGGRLARQTVRKAPSHYSFHYPITTTTGRYLTYTIVYTGYQPIRTATPTSLPTAVQVRRAYSSLRYSRHRPIRFDLELTFIRGDVKRGRQRAKRPTRMGSFAAYGRALDTRFEGPFEVVGLAGRCLGADHFAHRVRHISAPFGRFHFSDIFASHPPIPSKTYIWAYMFMC